jgi:DNA-directed RNA polymerase subunit alpha
MGITTLGELVRRSPDELLESRALGVRGIAEVREALASLGLRLRGEGGLDPEELREFLAEEPD